MSDRTLPRGYGALAVVVAALAVYALALGNGFAFDDVVLIPGDARVRTHDFAALILTPYWKDAALALYRPLTSLTFGLDWYASNGNAAWFHFSNIIWHALASLFAYLLLERFFAHTAAMVGALVFALHPVHVEAVANVVGRGELIAATFCLAACVLWATPSAPRVARLTLTLLCYLLAVFAKESAVVLPGLLLLIDIQQGRLNRSSVRRLAIDYACFTVALIVFLFVRWQVVGGLAPARLDPSLEVATTWAQRWLTALQAWPVFARLLFFPDTLLIDYGPRVLMPIRTWTPMAVAGAAILLGLLVAGCTALIRGAGRLAVGLFWFPLTILPVSNLLIPIGVLVAERTLYLPSFAVAFAVAALLSSKPMDSVRRWQPWLVTAVLVLLAGRTLTRIPVWQSTDTVMSSLLVQRPDNFRGQWHKARTERAHGRVEQALQHYDRALRLWPYREGLVQEAAAYGNSQGRVAWSREVAAFGASRWPENVNFHRLSAAAAVDLGDTIAARRAVQQGLRLHPGDTILNSMWRAFGPKVTP